jgi:transposase
LQAKTIPDHPRNLNRHNVCQPPTVKALQALRGVSLITAIITVAEIGDFSRFQNPKELMAYLGLVPSEHSSGNTIRRGGITKKW